MDRLLERFANPLWRVVEEAWQGGRITSRECMRRQVKMLRVSPEALSQELLNIRIDAGFHAFLQFCRSYGAEVKIVSDGLDRVVEAALTRAGLAVPFFANRLEWQGGNRWRLGFPFARSDCRVAAANCKCSHADKLRKRPTVLVGDGKSDFCMATRVDHVIAKGRLADYCRHRGQSHTTFTDFSDVTVRLSEWLARADRAQPVLLPASPGS